MTLAEYLQSQRVLSAEQVEQIEHAHDAERGEWVANLIVHHEYGESCR